MRKSVLGRKRVVQNLLHHLLRGTSAVVVGGPKMGKTTLLLQAAAGLTQTVKSVSVDLSSGPPNDPGTFSLDDSGSVILLLDGCEGLLPEPAPFVKEIARMLTPSGKNNRAVVWAGGLAWGEWAMAHRSEFGRPFRFYPLVLLPPKEAYPVLNDSLLNEATPAKLGRLVERAGGHPFLLSRGVELEDGRYASFFSELWEAADRPFERFVLTQLIEAGTWVRLEDLMDAAGGRPPKKVLDRLTTLGIIDRTLVEGAAAVKIVSPLFCDWARRTKPPGSGLHM